MKYKSYSIEIERYDNVSGGTLIDLYEHASDFLMNGEEVRIVVPGRDVYTIPVEDCKSVKIEKEEM